MKPSKAFQAKAVCLGVMGVLLVVSSTFGAGYSSGVTANVLTKTSLTADGQKMVINRVINRGQTTFSISDQ